jgi:hypothetical protein
MLQKYQQKIRFLALQFVILSAWPVAAEVACVSEVSYRWVRVESKSAGELPQVTEPTKPAAEANTTPGPGATDTALKAGQPGEQRVRFASVERRGKDEAAVKAGLLIEVNRQKSRAHERCRRDHESFGDCVSTKMSIKASTLNSLSFSARAKVEEALIDECRTQQGRCLAIDSSDATCRTLEGSAAPDGASAAAGGSSKNEEGDGKGAPKAADSTADKAKSAKKKP